MNSVLFSGKKEIPAIALNTNLTLNTKLRMDGLLLLQELKQDASVVFFDPQYRGVLDKMQYGNEGKNRGKKRCGLQQMNEEIIKGFIVAIDQALQPSGHLFLWMDKFHLCTGFTHWIEGTTLDVVDMITWDKMSQGMGYRSRRTSEHLVVLQKQPKRAKGVWTVHNIPDVWQEKIMKKKHTHEKPLDLLITLIGAVTTAHALVVDPAAGSFNVLEACRLQGRNFLGCDVDYGVDKE